LKVKINTGNNKKMFNQKTSQENKNSYKIILFEGIIVFSLLIFGFCLETFNRGLFFYQGVFHIEVIEMVLIRSFFATLAFLVVYRLVRVGLPFFDFLKIQKEDEKINKYQQRITILSDITIILGLILVSMPIRPILQKTFVESDVEGFSYFFARYDAIASIIILLVPAIVLVYYIYKYREEQMKYVHIAVIVIIVFAVGWANNSYNYDARISETRKNWIVADWDKQQNDANKALLAAKNDNEKATAYYWLGVSENRKGNHSKAIEYQLKAIELLPEHAAAHASLANGYLAEKNYIKSLEHSNKCIEYDPRYAWCYQALGNYYYYVGDIDNSLLSIKKAVELDPGNRELKKTYEGLLKIKAN